MSLNLRNEAALYSGDMAVDDQAHLLTFPLPTPIAVFALDGRLLAQVTHRTVPLPLLLSGNHREHIQLLIIPSPQSPLVFGHTWLKLHNPQIDWSLSKFVSWSAHCYSTCLHSAAPSCTQVAPVCLTPIGLTSAPSPYNDLSDVFSKDRAHSPSPHRPYDCVIDLLPCATLPSKQDAMELYIWVSLAGLTLLSSSPVGWVSFSLGIRITPTLSRLQRGKWYNCQGQVPITSYWLCVWPPSLTCRLLQAGFAKCIPIGTHMREWRVEDSFYYTPWTFWALSYALWIHQCSSGVSSAVERCSPWHITLFCVCLSRQYTYFLPKTLRNLLNMSGQCNKSVNISVQTFCQSEEISLLLNICGVPGICHQAGGGEGGPLQGAGGDRLTGSIES